VFREERRRENSIRGEKRNKERLFGSIQKRLGQREEGFRPEGGEGKKKRRSLRNENGRSGNCGGLRTSAKKRRV